ncbi:frizzled [Chironomus tepperi]|uniref:frizzled n=1 Tax=Chironomus tepperi TaxID=113505 RepID=UPI00391FBB61
MSKYRQFMFTKFSFIIIFSLKILVVISQQSSVLISSQESKSRYNQKEYNTQVSNINHHNKCEPISIPLCQDIQFYNQTIFPNLLNHARQDEAALEVHQFIPLIKINCSPDLKLFLCSLYAPLCTILEYPIPPCRKLCESARNCEKIMRTFDFPWPENLECTKFPEDGTDICISPNISSSSASSPSQDSQNFNSQITSLGKVEKTSTKVHNTSVYSHRFRGFICPVQLKAPAVLGYEINIGGKVVKDCGAPCNSLFFDDKEVTTLRYWISFWAVICALCCLFTILTFIIDSSRFRYPERPIVFLAICYLIVSSAYIFGLSAGKSVSCRDPFVHAGRLGRLQLIPTITQGHQSSLSCTVLFLMMYFCLMSAFTWWVFFALSWLLASGFKWGHEAIESRAHLFHLIAWSVPGVQTIFVLALGKVEGDILSGVCFVGTLSKHSIAIFLLIPLTIYLVLGTLFFSVGFTALLKIRTMMRNKNDGTRTDKLEKLMFRIVFFSILFVIPSFIYIGCLFYEWMYFDEWTLQWNRMTCKKFSIPCPPQSSEDESKPIFAIFMLKYLCSMHVGITSGLTWLCSSKTIASWKAFIDRLRGRKARNFV